MRSSFWKALRCLSATVILWCASVAAEDAGSNRAVPGPKGLYHSTEGGYSVAFGRTPTILSRQVATPAGELTLHSAVVESHRGSWSVNWMRYPAAYLEGRPADAIVEAAVGRMLEAGGWRSIGRTTVAVGRGRGVKFDLKRPASGGGPPLKARALVCLAEDRLFQVLSIWPAGSSTAETMMSFIPSFQLIGRGWLPTERPDPEPASRALLERLDPDRLRDAGDRAGEARIVSFAFVGEDQDRVGRDGPYAGRPNGEPDLHFRVELDLPPGSVLQAMSLSSGPVCRWVTVPNDRYWLLGVAREGMPITPGYMRSLGPFEGRQVFDIYGQGDFRAEEWFRLAVALTIDGRPVEIASLCSRSQPPAEATLTAFEWLDEDDDRVGENDPVKSGPNGKNDQHWRIKASLPEGAVVRSITVTQPDSLNRWQTKPDGHWWPLGVFREGEALAVGHVDELGPLSGDLMLDLYGNTGFPIEGGVQFLVELVVDVDAARIIFRQKCNKP